MNRKRKNRARRTGVVILVLVLLLACVALLAVALSSAIQDRAGGPGGASPAGGGNSPTAQVSSSSQPEPEPQLLKASFSAVGDNLVHDGIYLQAAARAGGNGYDFNYCFENVKYFFEPFDVNWMNQETLVNNDLPPSSYPQFSTPGPMGQATYDAGWRVYSLSNNHTYDQHADGIAATRSFWASMPEDVVTTGLFTNNDDDSGIALQEVNGMTVAYLSYTYGTNGLYEGSEPPGAEAHVVYLQQTDVIEKQVRRASELADAVVVGLHWGTENSHDTNQDQRDLAASIAGWGADIIIGTHPHVIQGAEWVQDPTNPDRKVFVAYSLGNFISAQAQANQVVGLCLTFDMEQVVDPDGTRNDVKVDNIHFYPTITHYDGGYTNIRDYMYRDYTDELAASHGVRERYPAFSKAYIEELLHTYVPAEYLVLD